MNKKKIIFVGGLWPKEYENYINQFSKGSIHNAANVLQNNLIRGIDEVTNYPVTILSMLFIGAYPRLFRKMIIRSDIFNHSTEKKHKDYLIGFLNIPLLKHYSKRIQIRKYIRKECKKDANTNIVVIGYSMTYAVTKTLLYIKKINPEAKTCLIVPDLPEYMSKKRGIALEQFKKYSNRIVYNDLKHIDSYVLLTEMMQERMPNSHPYVVVEGVAPLQIPIESNGFDAIKNIVYTGGLSIRYGIMELVEAFMNIQGSEYRLVLCGSGDAENIIREKQKIDKRIIFKGLVPNELARKIQSEAYILVNPRKAEETFTKYSFPSKTMEYMLSGRPVVMYKLPGIPEEYDNHIYYVNGTLEKTIKDVLSRSDEELKIKGLNAKNFIINEKNEKVQAAKIIKMIDSLS